VSKRRTLYSFDMFNNSADHEPQSWFPKGSCLKHGQAILRLERGLKARFFFGGPSSGSSRFRPFGFGGESSSRFVLFDCNLARASDVDVREICCSPVPESVDPSRPG